MNITINKRVYAQTAHNRPVCASPPAGGSGCVFAGSFRCASGATAHSPRLGMCHFSEYFKKNVKNLLTKNQNGAIMKKTIFGGSDAE
jgi:hypothetical protein